MKIINCGRGLHQREIKGIQRLQNDLPASWTAYTNLDLAIAPGKTREIDVIIVADDRIMLVDIKEWKGPIESSDGRWLNGGNDSGASPVPKLSQNARDVHIQLEAYLKKFMKSGTYYVPKVQGMVVLTLWTDTSLITDTEAPYVMGIGDFIANLASSQRRSAVFGPAHHWFGSHPLQSNDWKNQLSKFFNVTKGIFLPGRRNYGGYFSSSDDAVFAHPNGIYSEFEASDERASPTLGVLRLWDFTKAEARFQTPEGRAEIAGREQAVIAYLQDRSDQCDAVVLDGRIRDPDYGVDYWEIYDRRRRLVRLADFATVDLKELARADRIELARQAIAALDALHLAEAAHLDLGAHSIWVQRPSTIRLSHLMAASYPQVNTLGEKRYQFLSTGIVPEDVLGEQGSFKQRDIFLLGLSVHRLLFDQIPIGADGAPPEWDAAVDSANDYADLHGWFERALNWNATTRFANAGAALIAFNAATAERPTPAEVIAGLDQHRGKIGSVLQLITAYPLLATIRDDDRKALWRSERDGVAVLVKMWKRAAWGDQVKEGPRILDFLDRLKERAKAQPQGCASILDAFWMGDAIVMIQAWAAQPALAAAVENLPANWPTTELRISFAKALCALVASLHMQRIAHGDLTPSNILVDPADPDALTLIDSVDFASATDGELRSTAYAPELGGRYERDCFAVTRIVEELLVDIDPATPVRKRVDRAIAQIREEAPANSTLLPLIEALDVDPASGPADALEPMVVASSYAKSGRLLPDEGRYYLRASQRRRALLIRGACEELEVELDVKGRPCRATRRAINQGLIAMVSKFEFGSIEALIDIVDASANDYSALAPLFERPDVTEALTAPAGAEEEEVAQDVAGGGDPLGEDLIEEIASGPSPTGDIDVAGLWDRLIEAEKDLITFGEAAGDSGYRKDVKRHLVPFDLLAGSFDYDRRDRVLVERQDKRGFWRAIAHLDVQRSRPDALLLDAERFDVRSGPLVRQEDQLRFRSHFEETSLDRRHAAVSRITKRNARTRDLIDLFDPRVATRPTSINRSFDPGALEKLYGLNPVQAQALATILTTRPLALVQGPPGTGKTVFIAALVHAALTHGLARNVLLSSQAHEAVNNAAEAVLKLFAKNGDTPSILRVGNENVVSDRLLPFHAGRVERLMKDRFRAESRERLMLAARALGLDETFAGALIHIELAIRPVALRLAQLADEEVVDAARENALRVTFEQQLIPLDITMTNLDEVPNDKLVSRLVELCVARIPFAVRPSPDRVARFRSVAAMARDFVASVSSEQRSFETFLAGTRQIVAGTCVGLGRSALGLTTTPFDLVIVDEAARCTASELAVPIQAGDWVVLVGDHKQLEPLHDRTVVDIVDKQLDISKAEIVRSDFERVFETAYGKAAGHTLRTQYRMLAPIGDIISSSFYAQSPLNHGRTDLEVDPDALPDELALPVSWLDTATLGERGRQSDPDRRKSLSNAAEADGIIAMLRRWSDNPGFIEWLQKPSAHTHAIGIICAYANQRDLIRRKIQAAPVAPALRAALKVDTIDSYQGKQNPIVIVSLVRNNWDGAAEHGIKTIAPGFLATPNRINVALSRAMDRLVIVGSQSRWQTGSTMATIVAAFGKQVQAGQAVVLPEALLDQSAPSPSKPAGKPGKGGPR